MVSFQEQAKAIAEDWVAAWNKRDLDAILKHYDGNVQFVSPRVIASYEQHGVSFLSQCYTCLLHRRDSARVD
jgi:ketosteroid isomerase-like protein